MKKALEIKWGKRPADELPSEYYLAKKFDEIEKNNPPKMASRNIANVSIQSNTGHHIRHSKVKGSSLTKLIKILLLDPRLYLHPLSTKMIGQICWSGYG